MIIKKLAVPFLTLTLAAFGCSSSTTPTTGTGGAGGESATGGKGGGAGASATGTGGTAGSSATGGTAGSSATGTGGTAGGAGTHGTGGTAGTNGGGGAAGGAGTSGGGGTAGAGGAKADAGVSMSDCTVVDSVGTDILSATIFCQNQLQYCSNVSSVTLPYTTQDDCVAAFTANTNSVQKHCESYHLCWGVEGLSNTSAANPTAHCPHTVGKGGFCAADAGN
jgi:hypothetical protein